MGIASYLTSYMIGKTISKSVPIQTIGVDFAKDRSYIAVVPMTLSDKESSLIDELRFNRVQIFEKTGLKKNDVGYFWKVKQPKRKRYKIKNKAFARPIFYYSYAKVYPVSHTQGIADSHRDIHLNKVRDAAINFMNRVKDQLYL